MALGVACAGAGLAGAREAYEPPGAMIWHGVSDTGVVDDYQQFNRQVRSHTPLLQDFFHWGVPLTTGALDRWAATRTRGVLSLQTSPGDGTEVITPWEIANGRDDHYMLRLNASIAKSGQVVYIRPMAEMNLHYNPYSAFNADGSPRPGHGTRWYRQAWRRMSIIIRGGRRTEINARLTRLGMPRIYRAKSDDAEIYRRLRVPRKLARAQVAFMWMPMTISNPSIPANHFTKYWPGRRYVDWVGTDAYAAFSNRTLWRNLDAFYERYRKWPFAIGEYGPWNNDQRGRFTRRMFHWAQTHRRVRALLYFRSVSTTNEFNLQYYPGAKRALREILDRPRYGEFAPGTRSGDGGDGDDGTGGGISS